MIKKTSTVNLVEPCLQRAYGIDLSYVYDGAESLQRGTAALSHLSVPTNHHLLAAEHYVRRSLQPASIK